jgi:hypothetical protein
VLFICVGFEVTNQFAVCNFAIFWNPFQINKESSVYPINVPDALADSAQFVAQTNFK